MLARTAEPAHYRDESDGAQLWSPTNERYEADTADQCGARRHSPNSELSLKTSLGLDASDETSGVKRMPQRYGAFPHDGCQCALLDRFGQRLSSAL